eukprot:scaffold83034_cov63-Phaeocystis_antarctica.AAC.2
MFELSPPCSKCTPAAWPHFQPKCETNHGVLEANASVRAPSARCHPVPTDSKLAWCNGGCLAVKSRRGRWLEARRGR